LYTCSLPVPTAYLEQGIVVTDSALLRRHYTRTSTFRVDTVSVLPTDALYAWLGNGAVYVRINRLLRIGRLAEFVQRAESRTNYPNVLRVGILGVVVVLAIHWNACAYYQLSAWIGLGSDDWVYTPTPGSDLADHYFFCVYWSTMLLLTIGEMDHPVSERGVCLSPSGSVESELHSVGEWSLSFTQWERGVSELHPVSEREVCLSPSGSVECLSFTQSRSVKSVFHPVGAWSLSFTQWESGV